MVRHWGAAKWWLLAGLMAFCLWGAGCGGDKDQPASSQSSSAPAASVTKAEKPSADVSDTLISVAPVPAAPTPTPPPKQPGAVTGQFLDDQTSTTIPFATIRLSDAATTTIETLDGSFAIRDLPLGDYSARGAADGYTTATLSFSLTVTSPTRQMVFRLLPQGGVAGRVELAGGAPLEGASVYISYAFHLERNSTNKNGPETQSASDGTFLITGVQTGRTFNVVAMHPDYAKSHKGMFKLEAGHREEGIVLVMQPGGGISGVVRDQEGQPIAKAEVRAGDSSMQMMGNSNMMRLLFVAGSGERIETDDEGRFEYKNLAPNKYIVLATHDGYQMNFVDGVVVKSGETVENIELTLAPGAVFSGVVQNGRGEPVAKANINVSLIDLQRPVFGWKQTDDEGRFKFDTLRPGNFMMEVRADGYPQYRKMNQPVPQEDAVIVLPDGGRLMGRVTNESDGKPVRKFTMRVKKAPGLPLPFSGGMSAPEMPTSKTIENDDGRYEVGGLEAGLYIVMVMADDFAPAQKMGVKIDDNKDTTEDFTLNKGLVLKGRVVSAKTRQPISGAKVNLKDASGGPDMLDLMGIDELSNRSIIKTQTTNIDGEFEFSHLAPGSVQLQARADDYVEQSQQKTLEPDAANEIEILMERGATIRGRVIDAASKEPLSGAKVAIAQSGMFGRMFAEFREGELTGADGLFTVRTIPEGKAGLVVNRDGFAMLTTDKFTVYNDQEYNIGDLALTGGGRIAGLVSKGGQPVPSAAITAFGPSGIKMTSTGDDGRYEIAALEAGTYQVSLINSPDGGIVMGGNMQTLQKTTSVKEGETTDLDFELPGGFNLTGVVTKGGEPVEGWAVMYGPKGGAMSGDQQGGGFTNTDSAGRFSFTGLTNGVYQVSLSNGQFRPGTIPIPVLTKDVEIADADASIELTVPGASIGGIVVDEETGQPIASVGIHLFEEGVPFSLEEIMKGSLMGFHSAQTGADGRFQIENLSEKTWEVVAQHTDYSPGQVTVTLGDGESQSDLRLALKKGATLKGRAYSASTGVRVQQITLQFYTSAGRFDTSRTVTTDSQGNFTLTGLAEGQFTIEAFAENYAPILGLNVNVSSDAPGELVLQFPEGGTLALSVMASDGKPIVRAQAQITLEQTGRTLQYPATLEHLISFQERTYTNEQGRLTHPHLPAGSHLLRVTHEGHQPVEQRMDIFDGQTATVSTVMTPEE